MATVLLIGPWTPTSLAVARSLRRQRIRVHLVQQMVVRERPASCRALSGSMAMDAGLFGTAEGLEAITRYVRDIGAAAIGAILDSDLMWLAEHRHEFEPACRVLAPPLESLNRLLSKRYQLDLARRAGLAVLPTHFLSRPEDADAIADADFPLVVRPDRPDDIEPTFRIGLAASRQALRTMMDGWRRVKAPVIAQPFRSLPNLLVHGVRSESGDVISSRCYFVPRKFEHVTLTLEPRSFPDGLEAACREFVKLAGITGCYHLEFLVSPSDDRAYFLEVNVRLGGTTDKVVHTGFDEPLLLLESYGLVGPLARESSRPTVRRVANKRVLIKHLTRAVQGRLTELDFPPASRLAHVASSLRDLVVAKDSIFDWRDVAGSVRFHLRGLWRRG